MKKSSAYRFFFPFFVSFVLVNPNGIIPYYGPPLKYIYEARDWLIVWMGGHILHLAKPVSTALTGSGDRTFDYVGLLLVLLLSIFTSIIWTLLCRHKQPDARWTYWTRLIVRYYLAITMFNYGMMKIIKLQFPFPGLRRLLGAYGYSSPMALAWNFMGYSHGYNYFMGTAEALAGMLLLFRKTTTAGALLTIIVGTQIMVMNYCFDIPVKLLSTMIVLMGIYLIWNDLLVLIKLFFFRQSVQLSPQPGLLIQKKAFRIGLCVLKGLVIVYLFCNTTAYAIRGERIYGDKAPKSPLTGIYNVRTFVYNKDTLAPLQTDTLRWKRVVVDSRGGTSYGFYYTMDDSVSTLQANTDTVKHLLTMTSFSDSTKKYVFAYSFPSKDSLILRGAFKNDSMVLFCKAFDPHQFLLINRGFHWISESPYNR